MTKRPFSLQCCTILMTALLLISYWWWLTTQTCLPATKIDGRQQWQDNKSVLAAWKQWSLKPQFLGDCLMTGVDNKKTKNDICAGCPKRAQPKNWAILLNASQSLDDCLMNKSLYYLKHQIKYYKNKTTNGKVEKI